MGKKYNKLITSSSQFHDIGASFTIELCTAYLSIVELRLDPEQLRFEAHDQLPELSRSIELLFQHLLGLLENLVLILGLFQPQLQRLHLADLVLVALELDLQHLDLVGALVEDVDLVAKLPDCPGLLGELKILEKGKK